MTGPVSVAMLVWHPALPLWRRLGLGHEPPLLQVRMLLASASAIVIVVRVRVRVRTRARVR